MEHPTLNIVQAYAFIWSQVNSLVGPNELPFLGQTCLNGMKVQETIVFKLLVKFKVVLMLNIFFVFKTLPTSKKQSDDSLKSIDNPREISRERLPSNICSQESSNSCYQLAATVGIVNNGSFID